MRFPHGGGAKMFLFERILPRGRMIIKRHGRGDPGFAREAVINIAVIIPDSRRRNPSFLPPFAKGSLDNAERL